MRQTIVDTLEKGRVLTGHFATERGDRCGAFKLKAPGGAYLTILASPGEDWVASGLPGQPWEHVSVSLPDRTPTWAEMCWVKNLFWGDDECVVQFHPPKSEYVNRHEYCLHMWRPVSGEFPMPPRQCVG